MNKKNITILIQGPIYNWKEVLTAYDHYLNQGFNVVVSTWSSSEEKKLKCNKIVKNLPELITTIQQEKSDGIFVDKEYPYLKHSSFRIRAYYHMCSILNGMENIFTDFVIKIRADSFYSDLDFFVDVLLNNPDKYVCNNLAFRKDIHWKFHLSDHVIGMSRNNLYNLSFLLKNFIETYSVLYGSPKTIFNEVGNFRDLPPTEISIMKVFLMMRGVKVIERISKDIMKENVCVVPVSEMGKYKFQWNNQEIVFTNIPNNTFYTNPKNPERIKLMVENYPKTNGVHEFIPSMHDSIQNVDDL